MKRPDQPENLDTFGLPACDTHLIAKLRTLQTTDPQLLATIRGKNTP